MKKIVIKVKVLAKTAGVRLAFSGVRICLGISEGFLMTAIAIKKRCYRTLKIGNPAE